MSAFGKSLLKFKVRVSVLSPSLKVAKKKQKFEWHRNLTMNSRAQTETEYQDDHTRRTADTSGFKQFITPHSSRSLWYFAIGSVRPPPEEFENASFGSTVRPTVHTNPSRKRSFSITLFKRKNLKTLAFRFPVDLVPTVLSLPPSREEKRGPGNEVAENDGVSIIIHVSLTEFSSNTNPKWPVIGAFLISPG